MPRRWLAAAAAVAFVLCAAGALAADEVAVPPLKARVTDLTGTLSAAQRQAIEERLAEFEQHKGSQVAVLVLPTTGSETPVEYGVRVYDSWKLGRKGIDDGVLVLVAKDDRRVWIVTGRGAEGPLPDAAVKRIVEDDITPRFRQGDFYGGIQAGVERIMRTLEGEPLPRPREQARQLHGDPFTLLIALVVTASVLGAVLSGLLGRSLGSVATGGVVGALAWVLVGALSWAVIAAVIAFVLVLVGGATRGFGGWSSGGWGGGGFGGGFGGGGFGGGGFSGGGGGTAGGGAGGSW